MAEADEQMNEAEIRAEYWTWARTHPHGSAKSAYLAAALPREKRIAELEQESEDNYQQGIKRGALLAEKRIANLEARIARMRVAANALVQATLPYIIHSDNARAHTELLFARDALRAALADELPNDQKQHK